MNFISIIPLLALMVSTSLGGLIFLRNIKHTVNRAFALGTLSLLIIEGGILMIFLSHSATRVLFWGKVALVGLCFLPANWTLFSLVFARENYQELLKRWKGYVFVLYILGVIALFFIPGGWFIRLVDYPSRTFAFGPAGRYFLVYFLLATVVILVNLENTLRSVKEKAKRGVKIPLWTMIGAFIFCLYATSQMLLFSRTDVNLLLASSVVILLTYALLFYCALRHELMEVEVYIGRQVVYSSAMLLFVGIYLLAMGLIGKVVQMAGGDPRLFFTLLAAFIAIYGLSVILVSGSLKGRIKRFINRNFYRSKYDYREEWSKFSDSISTKIDLQGLLSAIINAITEMMFVKNAAILLPEEANHSLIIAETKNLSNLNGVQISQKSEFLDWLWRAGEPVKINRLMEREDTARFYHQYEKTFERLRSKVWVPLIANRKLIGILSLGEKISGEDYTTEDMELLETVANQSSVAILNAKLSEELMASRELESFYKFSSFVLHDLKNAVSMLSMVVKNAEANLKNPEFQKSMLDTISDVVEKMKGLMSRLSTAPKQIVLNLQLVDINSLIEDALEKSKVKHISRIRVIERLEEVPKLKVDPEQIGRVILNLIINAVEAMPQGGDLTLTTRVEDADADFVEIMITDTGVGMTPEFIKYRLFKPFQTTKKKGLGIGLYHCKEVVTAHGGQIRVKSKINEGTTFTLRLPSAPENEQT